MTLRAAAHTDEKKRIPITINIKGYDTSFLDAHNQ
jgi:hypothetical protein